MLDMNDVIANNILVILKKQNKKQVDLAEGIGVTRQIMSRMLNGTRMINAIELRNIADYLGVSMDELTEIPDTTEDISVVHAFMGRAATDEAKKALEAADELSDMILFHIRVRENGEQMMKPWGKANG